MINSRAHICSCQHIICQELGAPFASASVFFFSYSISAQHGQNHRNRDFYGCFLCAVFRFRFFCGQWLPPPRRLQVATTAVGSCNISISINNINNRQSPTPSAGRTFGLHFLLAQITLDVILLPPSVCLSLCPSFCLRSPSASLSLFYSPALLLITCLRFMGHTFYAPDSQAA